MSGRLSEFAVTFLRQAGATYATRLAGILLGLATAVLVSRTLGPEGRGAFSAAMALAALGVAIANLGLSTSNTYYAAKDIELAPRLIGNSLAASLVLGAGMILILCFLKLSFGAFHELDWPLFVGTMIWVPIGLCYLLLTSILLGMRNFSLLNHAEFALRALTLAMIAATLSIGRVSSPEALFLAALLVQIGLSVFVLARMPTLLTSPIRVSVRSLVHQIPFATKSYLALACSFLLVRIDLLMVQGIAGNSETGHYSIAASISDIIYVLPAVISQVLFPHLTAVEDSERRFATTSRMLIHVGWILAAISAMAWVLAPFAVPILFGEAFLPAVPMTRVLVVAVYFYGLNSILSNYFMAEGLPWSAVWVWVAALAINIALNVFWIPRFGGVGAAYASLVAYGAVFALQAAMFTQRARKRHEG